MPSLTLAEAETILAGAKAKVVAMGVKMSISVVDPSRLLKNSEVYSGLKASRR